MYKKYIIIIILAISYQIANAQSMDKSGKFGGPISTITKSNLGSSVSFGGWGTFMMRGNFHTGIYGQVSTSIISKKSKHPHYLNYEVKNRFTGLWLGYYQSFDKTDKVHISYFTKLGFGNVYLDNEANTTTKYDKAICITPSIEGVFKVTSFMHIGLGVFYEIYNGVDFLNYTNRDFNAFGASISIRFCPSNKQ